MNVNLQTPDTHREPHPGVRMKPPVDPNSGPAFRVLCFMIVAVCGAVVFKSYYDNMRREAARQEAAAQAEPTSSNGTSPDLSIYSGDQLAETSADRDAGDSLSIERMESAGGSDGTNQRFTGIVDGPDSEDRESLFPPVDDSAAADAMSFPAATESVTSDTANSTSRAEPIRQQAPVHDQMVTPGNFQYLGAFRPPHADNNGKEFTFGGWALAHRPASLPTSSGLGDSTHTSTDSLGSLFVLGHVQQQMVAEIAIPAPVISKEKRLEDLPVAEVKQAFGDITGGLRSRMTNGETEEFQVGGLAVAGSGLHWTMFKYYNVSMRDYPSHGLSSLQLSRPYVEGPWHLGPMNSGNGAWNSYKNAGYIMEVPEQARGWIGGYRFLSGLQIATGLNIASNGPALYAYNLPDAEARPGTSLPAQPLVYNDLSDPAKDFHPADRWSGGAWLTLGDKHSVVIIGRKATGPVHYGEARPQDCTTDKGYHGTPYEAQVLFYSPHSLAMAAQEKISPKQNPPWYVWNSKTPGGAFSQYLFPMCAQHTGGIAYDRDNNRLYVAQVTSGTTREEPFEALPIIHVFEIVE